MPIESFACITIKLEGVSLPADGIGWHRFRALLSHSERFHPVFCPMEAAVCSIPKGVSLVLHSQKDAAVFAKKPISSFHKQGRNRCL